MVTMEARELRIGNYVYGHMNEVCEVLTIGDIINPNLVGYKEIQNIKSYGQNGQKPIPLTEEWLLKLGFYKNIDTVFFEKSGFQIDLTILKCIFYLPTWGDFFKEIEYVHQLQNLYFALTGEELKWD